MKAEGFKEFFNDRAGQFAKEASLHVSSLLEMRWLIDLFRVHLYLTVLRLAAVDSLLPFENPFSNT